MKTNYNTEPFYACLIDKFCKAANTPFENLTQRTRRRDIVDKRMILMSILRKRGCKLQEIAKVFSFNHSTIIHHLKEYDGKVRFNRELRTQVEIIEQQFN